MLTFDKTNHEYCLNGKIIPSVTQVLRDGGIINTMYYNDSAKERGIAIHAATQRYDESDSGYNDICREHEPYLNAYIKFVSDTKPKWSYIEHRMAHEKLLFAGTADRIGFLNGAPCVLDIKTGHMQPWTAIQLAAYRMLFTQYKMTYGIIRYGLELRDNETYRLVKYTDLSDESMFISALSLYHYKKKIYV